MLCPHFSVCGGCATQDIPYADEVRSKEEKLAEILGRPVHVRPSPHEFHYRSRMDFVYAWGKLGLRKKGDPQGVEEIETCLLIPPRALEALRKIREWIRELKIPPYSYVAHKGYLRYVTVREAPVSGELMLILLTNGTDPLARDLLDRSAALAESAVWASTDQPADVNYGTIVEWKGRPWIEERIGNLRLRFGANSFFQSNPWLTEEIYGFVAQRVEGRTTDLYCGVGGIALSAASRAPEIVGIELNREAVGFADENARRNDVRNAHFYVGDARLFLDTHRCDTLIVDPPRSGLGPKIVRKILRAAPRRVIYVSCNPKSLAAEIPGFNGYRLTELEAFDLFPKTPHVETVAIFDRIA